MFGETNRNEKAFVDVNKFVCLYIDKSILIMDILTAM